MPGKNQKEEKSKYHLIQRSSMEVFFLPGEAVFLTFKLVNGSGWLTNHRLIIVEHKPGKLKEGTRKDYSLKNFEKAQIKDSTLRAHFKDKKVKIQLPTYAPSLLQEIKDFIEESAKQWNKPET
jgi:hypothetical protein